MIRVGWCNDRDEIDRLAEFFARNVTQSYISHSELQFGRAEAPDKWIDDLVAKFKTAYVTFNTSVPIAFMVLEDIVVDRAKRGSGFGQTILDWVFAQGRREGIKRAFLESGKENHDAHHFFERNGFHQVSIVMMADLAEP